MWTRKCKKQTLKAEKLKYSGRSSKHSGRHKDVSDELLPSAGSALSPFHQASGDNFNPHHPILSAVLYGWNVQGAKVSEMGHYCTLQTSVDVRWHHIHSGKSNLWSGEFPISLIVTYQMIQRKHAPIPSISCKLICRHILRKRHFISRGTMCVGEAVCNKHRNPFPFDFHKQFSR